MHLPRNLTMLLLAAILPLSFAACTRDQVPADETGEPAVIPEPVPTTPAPAAQPMTAQLTALNNSGVTGTAELTAEGDQATRIKVTLNGATAGGVHQGHVHSGTCDAPGGVVVPLQAITVTPTGTGEMEATVTIAPATAMNGQHIILYHEAGGSPGAGIACAPIPAHTM